MMLRVGYRRDEEVRALFEPHLFQTFSSLSCFNDCTEMYLMCKLKFLLVYLRALYKKNIASSRICLENKYCVNSVVFIYFVTRIMSSLIRFNLGIRVEGKKYQILLTMQHHNYRFWFTCWELAAFERKMTFRTLWSLPSFNRLTGCINYCTETCTRKECPVSGSV